MISLCSPNENLLRDCRISTTHVFVCLLEWGQNVRKYLSETVMGLAGVTGISGITKHHRYILRFRFLNTGVHDIYRRISLVPEFRRDYHIQFLTINED